MNQNKSNTRAIRALFGKSSHWPNRQPVAAVVVAPVDIARIEVQAPCVVGSIVRIRRGGPAAAVRAEVVEAGVEAVAGSGKKDAL